MSILASKTTKAVAFRLENVVYGKIERRAKRQGIKVSEYLRNFITTDVKRKR